MDNRVKKALSASINKYIEVSTINPEGFEAELIATFELDLNFLEKVKAFDEVFDSNPKFEELREVSFDLLMVNFFSSDVQKLEEDYLEGDEWAKIEEKTIDRGTELLNLLLYIKECKDEDIDPELGDFLKEFLLVEDDEFQDEFEIYEELISNQQLAESGIEELCKTAPTLNVSEEMEELFVPFMAFFFDTEGSESTTKELAKFSANKSFDVAVYTLITQINN
ncbi:hypothetical protein EZJ43_07580 [Pedobacter changchengzhani]|uniref:Uncharacterized protein n=1 Tax=Pedobacter changchengzhani TaxID=2529274 RepID=A0A4V3A061_9SPHI|nr:hypothetical protein [Pedobacter changchengzhani]TDG36373.1 hypothetical protein EZJ43_07580 [Pedobacter changchengzhani]